MNKEYTQKIINLYTIDKFSIKVIGKMFNYTERRVSKLLKENKVIIRASGVKRYELNDDYFHEINTEIKAYWLGYLYADGNVSSSTNVISLSSINKEILEKFRYDLNSIKKITTEYHKLYKKEIYKFAVTSEIMKKDLISHGRTPRKSNSIIFPKLDPIFISSFIRGYFDGDGSVGIYKNKNGVTLRSSICSASKIFLEELVKYLPIKHKIIKSRNNRLYLVGFSVKDSISFYNYIYFNHSVCLSRKREIFESYIKIQENRKTFNDYNTQSQVD